MLRPKIKGFTLIELIVALSIFAVMSVLSYKGLTSLIQTKERVSVEDEKWQQLIVFFDRIELDLKQSVNRSITDRDGILEPAFIGRPNYAGDYGAQLIFSRFGDREQTGFLMDTRRIAYRLKDGAVELLIWPSTDAAPNSKPEIFKVLPHVAQIYFTYLTQDGRFVNEWPDRISVTDTSSYAPTALKILIKLDGGEAVSRIFAL
jgi:general secretion pathway protein J